MSLRLYFDDDCAPKRLLLALRDAAVDCVSSNEAGTFGSTDERHLEFATADGRVLCSSNIADFIALHRDWLAAGRTHAGLILIRQQRYSLGEQRRRLVLMNQLFEMDDIHSRFEFLSDWRDA